MATVVYVTPKLLGMSLVTWFWTLAITTTILLVFIILNLIKGGAPLVNILKAAWLGRPTLLILRKDNVAELRAVKYDTGNLVDKQREFIAVPNAVYRLKGGTAIGVADERYGATVPFELVVFAMEARKNGVKPEDFADAIEQLQKGDTSKVAIDAPNGQRIEADIELSPELKKTKPELLVKHLYEIGVKYDSHTKTTKKYIRPLTILRTLDIHDVAGYFIYNINPFAITARIEKRVTAKLQELQRKDWRNFVIPFIIIVFTAALAYIMIRSGAVQGAASAVKSGASVAATQVR